MAKYLVLIYGSEQEWDAQTPAELEAKGAGHIAFSRAAGRRASAAVRSSQSATTATTLRASGGGTPVVTDGPFMETKEALGGFYIVDVPDLDAPRSPSPGCCPSCASSTGRSRCARSSTTAEPPCRPCRPCRRRAAARGGRCGGTRPPRRVGLGCSPRRRGSPATSTSPRSARRTRTPRPSRRGRGPACRHRPGAWLTTVAANRARDVIRREVHGRRVLPLLVDEEVQHGLDPDAAGARRGEPGRARRPAPARLHLLPPGPRPESQVALTLRLLCGLSTGEVARAFLVREATMAARITRAKKKIAAARIPYRVPAPADLPVRVHAVAEVIHLVFTTGHDAPSGDALVRQDLVDSAIRMARMLRELLPDETGVTGLLALMLLVDARSATRVDEHGELVAAGRPGPLALGSCPGRRGPRTRDGGARRRSPDRYAVEAAIAAVHCRGADAGRKPTGSRSSGSTTCSNGSGPHRSCGSTGPSPSACVTGRRRTARDRAAARRAGAVDLPLPRGGAGRLPRPARSVGRGGSGVRGGPDARRQRGREHVPRDAALSDARAHRRLPERDHGAGQDGIRQRRPGVPRGGRNLWWQPEPVRDLAQGARVSVVPDGRRLLRVEARNAETPIERKPSWIRTTAKMGPEFTALHSMVKSEGLHTVCQEAGCPNIFECWEDREATFLIGGDVCTRRCDFCDIATGRPTTLDLDEPRRVAESVRQMGLRYSTVTGVARDDQPDGAAGLYAETIRQIHLLEPQHRCRDPAARLRRQARAASARSSTPAPRSSRTTSRRCRASSSGSARPSPTRSRSRC